MYPNYFFLVSSIKLFHWIKMYYFDVLVAFIIFNLMLNLNLLFSPPQRLPHWNHLDKYLSHQLSRLNAVKDRDIVFDYSIMASFTTLRTSCYVTRAVKTFWPHSLILPSYSLTSSVTRSDLLYNYLESIWQLFIKL